MHIPVEIKFNIKDRSFRIHFLQNIVLKLLEDLHEDTMPSWGKMTPQEMIEHLAWTFEVSTGRISVECLTPEDIREQAKINAYKEQPYPRNFSLPTHRTGLPDLRHQDLNSAKSHLAIEIDFFINQLLNESTNEYTHPVLGSVDSEHWSILHFKHCYHHLSQFALISEVS